MERAQVLDQVLALMDEGEALQADSKFDDARDRFQQAIALDPAHEPARQALAGIATAQANQNFAAVMSRGFTALQAGNAEAAKAAFEQAGSMRPGSSEVAAALQQAKDQQTLSAITVQINAATVAEANEDWATALAAWNAALVIDPNLVDAQTGQRRTQSRTNLDNFLTDTIANPLRLGDDAVYAQTEQVLRDATTLLTPGPKLQSQLQQVQAFLARAKVPVDVTIQSDGQTTVTLYGVGELGLLTTKTVSLPPGSYVAVGVRAGYRDVRQEFVVGLDGQGVQITVSCNDTI
jgi:tetratricopeptide (TPR) repeat protein